VIAHPKPGGNRVTAAFPAHRPNMLHTPNHTQSITRGLALVLVLLAFGLSATLSRTVFERLPHLEDEIAYLYQARVFAAGHITAPQPEPTVAFWQPFVVMQDGKAFSKYTPGWSLMLALGVLAGAPWIVNAVCAALSVALIYRIGEELFSMHTGLIAAALLTFSPMALLLNATLMSHTAALTFVLAFTYAYWRLGRARRALLWGIIAGAALGSLAVSRLLTAVAIATPFIIDSLVQLGLSLRRRDLWPTLRPRLALGAVALAVMPVVPAYNYATTGDPFQNTYELIWEYDRVGFGPHIGRNGHTLEKGIRHARFDLSLTAVDLFGWQFVPLNAEQQEHLLTDADYYPGRGYSWVLLPFGLAVGLFHRQRRWALLLTGVVLALVAAHLAYWIGSQRYSTRYYFEALGAAALLTAIPLGALARTRLRPLMYIALITVTTWNFTVYGLPRVQALNNFNEVSEHVIQAVNERRQTDRPALIIITGDSMTWRAGGSLLAVTGPFLDTDIVLARNVSNGRYLEDIHRIFPDREIIPMIGEGSLAWFDDEVPSS
jgi:hypothetical protein